MLREVPYGAFQIAFFELAKLMLGFLGEWGVPIFFQRMAWGAVAGSGAAFLTTPFDVITSRVMLSSAPAVEDGGGLSRVDARIAAIIVFMLHPKSMNLHRKYCWPQFLQSKIVYLEFLEKIFRKGFSLFISSFSSL